MEIITLSFKNLPMDLEELILEYYDPISIEIEKAKIVLKNVRRSSSNWDHLINKNNVKKTICIIKKLFVPSETRPKKTVSDLRDIIYEYSFVEENTKNGKILDKNDLLGWFYNYFKPSPKEFMLAMIICGFKFENERFFAKPNIKILSKIKDVQRDIRHRMIL